ncbi:MAG: hypothetical protein BGO95_09290 [Micrococcales bacterium 73-13]|mgnify:CR=1 FL=1|nr:MAG: hypothetical protein BGO95_09290 [Micrococcales bacterium 73-13]
MSIVVVARLFPKPGRKADFLAALEAASPAIHAERGCELYAGHEAPDGSLVLIEKWATQADLDAHAVGEPVLAYRAAKAEFEERPPVVEALVPLGYGDATRGTV